MDFVIVDANRVFVAQVHFTDDLKSIVVGHGGAGLLMINDRLYSQIGLFDPPVGQLDAFRGQVAYVRV